MSNLAFWAIFPETIFQERSSWDSNSITQDLVHISKKGKYYLIPNVFNRYVNQLFFTIKKLFRECVRKFEEQKKTFFFSWRIALTWDFKRRKSVSPEQNIFCINCLQVLASPKFFSRQDRIFYICTIYNAMNWNAIMHVHTLSPIFLTRENEKREWWHFNSLHYRWC